MKLKVFLNSYGIRREVRLNGDHTEMDAASLPPTRLLKPQLAASQKQRGQSSIEFKAI